MNEMKWFGIGILFIAVVYVMLLYWSVGVDIKNNEVCNSVFGNETYECRSTYVGKELFNVEDFDCKCEKIPVKECRIIAGKEVCMVVE